MDCPTVLFGLSKPITCSIHLTFRHADVTLMVLGTAVFE